MEWGLRAVLVFIGLVLAVPAWAAERPAHDETYINLFGGNTFLMPQAVWTTVAMPESSACAWGVG